MFSVLELKGFIIRVFITTVSSENIRYGALFRTVTEDEVRRAAIAANINNFILSLPDVSWSDRLLNCISFASYLLPYMWVILCSRRNVGERLAAPSDVTRAHRWANCLRVLTVTSTRATTRELARRERSFLADRNSG